MHPAGAFLWWSCCPAALHRHLTAPGRKASTCAQAAVLPGLDRGVELVPGDVFQYATLPRALGDANALIIATGARAAFDPFGPFSVDYEARPGVPSAFAVENRQA